MTRFLSNYLAVLQRFKDFKTRATRFEYWAFVLVNLIIGLLLSLIGVQWLDMVYQLAILIPSIAVAVRRLHDSSRSGWWLLVPIANLVFLCMPSTPEDNKYYSANHPPSPE
ncbi:TPA: DUF805 domain-containing protein [Aeromonas veronii]|nr:DUF805 domain-containing protein [Aeromonas veronii]